MKLTRLFSFKFTCFIIAGLLTLNNAFANSKNDYAAVISFSDHDSAKWLVYKAYMSLARFDNKLGTLYHHTGESLSGTYTPEEKYYLDLKFQSTKHDLDKLINQSTAWFSIFNRDEVTVEINDDGQGKHLLFHLPRTTLTDLNLHSDDLSSIENAKMAESHINAALEIFNAMLPSGFNGGSLKKFITTNKLNQSQDQDIFYVASVDDSKAILRSLFDLRMSLSERLYRMLKLANVAATGEHTAVEMADFNTEFQSLIAEFSRILEVACQFGNIKIFNGNKLIFKLNGQERDYLFTQLDLDVLHLKNDNIIDFSSASHTLEDLQLSSYWIRDWMISGNTSTIGNVTNKSISSVISFLNITEQDKLSIKKTTSHS